MSRIDCFGPHELFDPFFAANTKELACHPTFCLSTLGARFAIPFHAPFPRPASNSMNALHHLRLLGRVLLVFQTCLFAVQAAVVEVDLIFPRNETYAPGPFMPVVFAIQNSAIAAPLDIYITWHVTQLDGNASTSGALDLRQTNFTRSDPFFVFDVAQRLNGTEGTWAAAWALSLFNCSVSTQAGENYTTVTKNLASSRVVFTTRPDAPGPNLVQSPKACVGSKGVVINIAETLPVNSLSTNDGHGSCHVLASPPSVTGNSCSVTVNETTAVSILGKVCGPDVSTTCPSESGTTAKGTPVLVAWLSPMLAALLLYMTV